MTSSHDDMEPFFEEIPHDLEDSEEEKGYETPEETPAEFSLTPIASPTKYRQEHTDILTDFIIKATGYVDIINRNMLAMENVNYNDGFRFQEIISTAKYDLNYLKDQAIANIELQRYVFTNFKTTDLASFLNDIITTMKKESRDLMDEAHKEGAKVAKQSWKKKHIRRKQSAERKLKESTKSSNDHREPTPTCGPPGGCTIALRL